MIPCRLLGVLLAPLALLPACRKAEVLAYRVPKESTAQAPAPETPAAAPAAASVPATPSATAGGTPMSSTPVATATGPALTWTAPTHWKPKPGSPMRKGSFAVPGEGGEADLSITAFPGNVGGDLANLNRWRDQVHLPPVSQAEFESGTQRIERNGLKIIVVDLAGTGANATRILGAMIPFGGATWFVKLIGPDAIVAKEKSAFNAFLDTIKPAPASQ